MGVSTVGEMIASDWLGGKFDESRGISDGSCWYS